MRRTKSLNKIFSSGKFPKSFKGLAGLLLALFLGGVYSFFGDKTGEYLEANVIRVVDGDTINVTVNGEDRRVRLIGVDTPETVHPKKPVQFYGKEASAFTKKTLLNRKVWLEYDVAPLDKYQRHLAYVWLENPNNLNIDEASIRRGMFNAILVIQGYGQTMTIQPNSRYSDIFAKFQKEARSAKRGLWGSK